MGAEVVPGALDFRSGTEDFRRLKRTLAAGDQDPTVRQGGSRNVARESQREVVGLKAPVFGSKTSASLGSSDSNPAT